MIDEGMQVNWAQPIADGLQSGRKRHVNFHVTQNASGRRSAIDQRTSTWTGDAVSQQPPALTRSFAR